MAITENRDLLELLSRTRIIITKQGEKTMARIDLDNGMTITGTPEQIKSALEKLGFKGDSKYYYSESSGGVILISTMNTSHLRNAILKIYKEWLDALYAITDPRKFIDEITNPSLERNTTFVSLVREMNARR